MTDAAISPQKTRELQTRVADSTIWNEFRFRNDDIVIATYQKAGTTWMQQIVGQLLFGGDPHLNTHRLSPWVDSRLPPKDEKLAQLEAQTHRRFLKTHLPADALVMSPKAQYIYVGRDGRDVVWSYHNHLATMTPEHRDRLNNLPGVEAPLMEPPPADIREFWRLWLDRENYPQFSFWNHIQSWWALRARPNVLLMHFANLKRDMPSEIRRIAAFLDVPIDEARWDAILEYCSFDSMKARAAGKAAWQQVFVGGEKSFFHRGVNGRWVDTLTPEDIAEYEARAVRELGPECAHWLATGHRP